MDPFTALGLVSNIVQFIDFSAKLIDKACAVHSSLTGATTEDEKLEFVISEMRNLSVRLTSSKPSYQQSEDEKAVVRLATQCGILSDAILELLERIKARNPKSKRSSAVAAVKSAWKENEKLELKQRLDSCRSQLQVQLTSLMRSETMERLEELIRTGQLSSTDLSSLKTNVELLKKGVNVTHIDQEAIMQLKSLLGLSDQALQAVARHRILEGLRFELMNNRFNEVAKAHGETFQWILDESCEIPSSVSQGKSQLSFQEWLACGSGIFHIQGKPGSGKSTLMKFLCQQTKTGELLQKWAETRKLVTSKFFFWKPGTARQKSLNGLLRALLYDVVSQRPGIIPSLFKRQYSGIQQLAASVHLSIHFEDDEISSAFDRLLEISDESVRFCFFIDGLDEFEGDHKELISKLKSWTARCRDVKICVSSRELNIFTLSFSAEQRLKLQELTENDIRMTVYDALENNEQFTEIQPDPKKGREFLEGIVRKADGVFLWVTLVLASIEDGLLSKCRFHDLQRKVGSAPLELEKLFRHVFETIDHADLVQSYLTFTLVQNLRAQKRNFSLFRYSWLNEYDENKDFAMELPIRNPAMSEQEVLKRLDDAKMRLNAHCRGLVEVRPYRNLHNYQLLGQDLDYRLVLAHRSIAEFLQEKDIQRQMESRLKGVDVVDAALQTFLAQGKSANLIPVINFSHDSFELGILYKEVTQVLSSIREAHREDPRDFRYLDCLESAIFQRPNSALWPAGNTERLVSKHIAWRLTYMAAESGLFPYIVCKLFSHDGRGGDGLDMGQLLCSLLQGQAEWRSQDGTRALEYILNGGADPNCRPRRYNSGEMISGWHLFLLRLTHLFVDTDVCGSRSATQYVCQTIKLCLQFKADPRFHMAVARDDAAKSWVISVAERSIALYRQFQPDNEFTKYAFERGGIVSLRDLVVFLQPDDPQSIFHLIDRNLRLYGESSAMEHEPEEKLSPEMTAESEKTETHKSQQEKEPHGEGSLRRAEAYGLDLDSALTGRALPFLLGISLALVLPPLWRYIFEMFSPTPLSGDKRSFPLCLLLPWV